MADSRQYIRRVNELPSVMEANAIYVVKPPGSEIANLVFTGSDPTVVCKTIDSIGVEQIVEDAMAASSAIEFKQTYSEMLLNRPAGNALVYVADTTGDPTATTQVRVYLYNKDTDTFTGFPNQGGGGTPGGDVYWNAILGKPSATPAQIDQAVAAMHTHNNKAVLDLISENAQQKLVFRGLPVDTPSTVTFVAANW